MKEGRILNLKILRRQARMTQEDLANRVGVSRVTLARGEMGTRDPGLSFIKKLSMVLNVSEAELLNGPKKNELTINFVWEVEDMDVLNIESNHFNFGFRKNDVVLWGALPDDEDDESMARKIVIQIRAARAGKKAANDALKKLEDGK
jgi:transcriptional regulator with XRE-family HTH domain